MSERELCEHYPDNRPLKFAGYTRKDVVELVHYAKVAKDVLEASPSTVDNTVGEAVGEALKPFEGVE